MIFFLLIISLSATAQITLTSNPAFISPGTTSVQYVDLPTSAPFSVEVIVKTTAANSSTVQINTFGDVVTSCPAMAADKQIIVTVIGRRFWVKLANSADDIEISW